MNKTEYLVKLIFRIQPEQEEIFLAVLQEELGYYPSIYEEPNWDFSQVQFYVPLEKQEEAILKTQNLISSLIKEQIIVHNDYKISVEILKEEDWMNHWKKYFHPILVGKKLQITPFWYPINPERMNLVLEPKMGFGTGQHPTTFLCLEGIENENMHDKGILDLGAGSGILGVSSVLLGAQSALLLEIDELSIQSCKDTVERNSVEDKVQVLNADVFTLSKEYQGPYDLAFINIIAEVIVDILALPWLKEIPILYLSGILQNKKYKVYEALNLNKWELLEERILGDWVWLKVKSNL